MQGAEEVAEEHPGPVGQHRTEGRGAGDHRQGHEGEAAGDEFQAEQHDHHEADRENEGADDGLAGLHGGTDREAGGEAEKRSGERAADQKVERAELGFRDASAHHAGHDLGGLQAVHGASVCWARAD